MDTGLYDERVEKLSRSSLEHRFTVEFTDPDDQPIPLDVLDAELTFDDEWTPYVQGTVTAAVPEDQAVLDALDPRARIRCTISAGYVLPGGILDVHPLAVLYLTKRNVTRPGDELSLSVQGTEYLYDGWRALYEAAWAVDLLPAVWDDTTTARDAVTRCLVVAGAIEDETDPAWDYARASTETGWADAVDHWIPTTGDPALDFARDIAERVGVWLRCDETGVWRLTPRAFLSGEAVAQLKVGANGTLLTSDTGLSREGWANAVLVRYTWGDGTATGYARVSSGDYSVDAAGQVTHYTDLPWKGHESHARARASNTLRRLFSRGRSMTLSAVAAYWLRPGSTVTVQLPLGDQERHLVSAVTYSLGAGSMSLTTRVPDDAATITTGA